MAKNSKITVDPLTVVKIESEGTTAYTVQAYREGDGANILNNIILQIDSQGKKELIGITYKLGHNMEIDFENEEAFSYFSVEPGDLKTARTLGNGNCWTISVDMCSYGSYDHYRGVNCTVSFYHTERIVICDYPCCNGNNINGSGSSDRGSGSGSGNGGYSPVNTAPVNNAQTRAQILSEKAGLSPTDTYWLAVTLYNKGITQPVDDLYNYVVGSKGNPAVAKAFVALYKNTTTGSPWYKEIFLS